MNSFTVRIKAQLRLMFHFLHGGVVVNTVSSHREYMYECILTIEVSVSLHCCLLLCWPCNGPTTCPARTLPLTRWRLRYTQVLPATLN